MRSVVRTAVLAGIVLFLRSSATEAGTAQYFGRNKVQYKDLKFKILKTEHFDIYFYPEKSQGAEIAARLAERWYERLSTVLTHTLRGRQPLILYASSVDFQRTNVIPGELGEGVGGVSEPLRRRERLAHRGSRCGSSKAWRNTCRLGPSIRTQRCGCGTRRRSR